MVPLKLEAVVELLIMAPPPLMPVPLGTMGSTEKEVRLKPLKSKTASLLMVVAPADVPKGPLLAVLETPSFNVPALMVVAPV